MKNLELYLAEVRKKSVAVYLACDQSVATDISNTLEKLCNLLEDSLNEIEGYSGTYGSGVHMIPEEAKIFLEAVDKRMNV